MCVCVCVCVCVRACARARYIGSLAVIVVMHCSYASQQNSKWTACFKQVGLSAIFWSQSDLPLPSLSRGIGGESASNALSTERKKERRKERP